MSCLISETTADTSGFAQGMRPRLPADSRSASRSATEPRCSGKATRLLSDDNHWPHMEVRTSYGATRARGGAVPHGDRASEDSRKGQASESKQNMNSGNQRPNLVGSGQIFPNLGPNLVNAGPEWPKSTEIVRNRPGGKFGTKSWSTPGNLWPTSFHVAPNFGRCQAPWPQNAQVRPGSTALDRLLVLPLLGQNRGISTGVLAQHLEFCASA